MCYLLRAAAVAVAAADIHPEFECSVDEEAFAVDVMCRIVYCVSL